MRQLIMTLMVVLMSMMVSTPVSAKSNKKSVQEQVPENIVVKQTTRFNDGRTLTIYYKNDASQMDIPNYVDDLSFRGTFHDWMLKGILVYRF